MALQTDGKLVVGGEFTTILDQSRNHIARLNADDTLDTAFNPNADDAIAVLKQLSDGKLVAGGYFSLMGGQSRNALARLNV